EGVPAYAKCQASIQESIRQSFERKWMYVDQWLALGEMDDTPMADNEDVFGIVK
ncbi:hypothetical protein EDD18DRAFT_1081714, partial [Armillaria luteobubalina]